MYRCPHVLGANCRETDARWEHVYANVGWWTSGSRDDTYYMCPLKSSCIGGSYVKNINGTVAVKKKVDARLGTEEQCAQLVTMDTTCQKSDV